MEREAGTLPAIAQRIQLLKPGDAAVEHALAALPVHTLQRVAGQGCDDLDAVGRQKIGQIVLPRFGEDRQVAAVDDLHAQRPRALHQPPEVRVQLGRAAGQIQGCDAPLVQHLQHQIDRFAVHRFAAVRPGTDMAMDAALVAAVAEVDLQGVEPSALDRREIDGAQQVERGMHEVGPWSAEAGNRRSLVGAGRR